MTLEEMPADARGLWQTTTRNGTIHLWDMDERTFIRNPHAKSHNYGMGPGFNDEVHAIRDIFIYPKVGQSFYVTLDTREGSLRSSTVVKIEHLG